jgi:mono/diheme cytochrome c family protein
MAQFKKSLMALSTGLSLLVLATNSFAKLDGLSGYSGNPGDVNAGLTCTSCHALSSGIVPPAVRILGPRTVKTNSTNSYKIVMTRQESQVAEKNRVGGVNISTDSGSLFIKNRLLTQPSNSEIVHKLLIGSPLTTATGSRRVMVDGKTITWLFEWVAPAVVPAQPSNIFVSVLSGNNDSNVSGDSSRSIKFEVNVVAELQSDNGIPKAVIRAPFTIPVNIPVSFIASESTVTGKSDFIENYEWVFSDRNAEKLTMEQESRVFTNPGFVTATLKVTTNKGLTSNSFFDIQVTANGDTASEVPAARISAPVEGNLGTEITFDASGSSPQPIKKYIWDFGDPNDPIIAAPTSDAILKHIYSTVGTYTVTLAVQSAGGLTNIDSFAIKIVDGTAVIEPPPTAVTGVRLYNDPLVNGIETNCTGNTCHLAAGAANGTGAGSVKNIQGTTQLLIDNSIAGTNGVPTTMMTRIQNAISVDINSSQLIADYLGQIDPAVSLIDGKILYETRCLLCHGINADGIPPPGLPVRGLAIKGATQSQIINAINQVVGNGKVAIPLMAGIKLSDIEASYLVTYLALPAGAVGNALNGATLFTTNCQDCHGTGSGGLAINITNTTTAAIDRGITNVQMMQNITLKAQDKLDIVAYLTAPLPLPPVTGKGMFDMYCSYCHGIDGKGGIISEKSIAGKTYKVKEVIDAYTNNIDAMRNSNLIKVGFTDGGAILDLNLVVQHIEQLKGSN